MAQANRVHSTPPTSTPTIDENTLSMRLLKAGMRLERHGDHFQVHSGNQIVLARTLTNKPLTLADIDDMTRRLADPVVDPTRRLFLTQAAGIAAGGTVLALATIPPASVLAAPAGALDPVFALIEAHKAAEASLGATIRALDHAGRDAAEDALADAAHEAECAVLDNLLEAVPTTLAGVAASLTYFRTTSDGLYRLDVDMLDVLFGNLAEALEALAVAS
jgi:hypothetical protein